MSQKPRRTFTDEQKAEAVQIVNQSGKLRLIALGDYSAVRDTINQLGALGYADPNKWTKLMPTGREGEYISIHTRRYAPPTE